MAKKKNATTPPLTFALPLSLIEKIATLQKKLKLGSTSEVVREVVANFDIDRCSSTAEPQRQISVRLPGEMKTRIARGAKKKKISVGGLLRIALDAYEVKFPAKKARRK